jgi:antagonist of KipI
MSVKVIRPGVFTTLQDSGRFGYGCLGISRGGALDEFAFQAGNFLTGNRTPLTSLEFIQTAPELYFESSAIISITGPGCYGVLNEKRIPPWHAIAVTAGSVLKIFQTAESTCGYLSIRGGWSANIWLGSESTHLYLGISGHEGRRLKKDDTLKFNVKVNTAENRIYNWTIPPQILDQIYGKEKHVCCLKGPDIMYLGEVAADMFSSQEFFISAKSDRMGYRLNSKKLKPVLTDSLISSPVTKGTIQLLPDGQLIILMADHQTIGGYPRIGCVIDSDLPRLAQRTARQPLYFSWCSIQVADELLQERSQWLTEIATTCRLNFNSVMP